MAEVRMDRLTWVEYQARLAAQPPVFLPCGALEQHGPHLPLGVDALLATRVAEDVAAAVGGLVAPTQCFGYKSQGRCGGGETFPGTTSLDGAHLTAVVADVLRELIRHGQRRLVLCDGHYENQWFLVEAAELAAREARATGVRIMRAEYWDYCAPAVLDAVFPAGFPGFALEHAAVIETSLMLHYAPELVRLERLPDDGPAHFRVADVYPQDGHGVPTSGVLSSARGASAAHGARLAASITERFAAEVREIFALG